MLCCCQSYFAQGHPLFADPTNVACGSSGRNLEAAGISGLYPSTGKRVFLITFFTYNHTTSG